MHDVSQKGETGKFKIIYVFIYDHMLQTVGKSTDVR